VVTSAVAEASVAGVPADQVAKTVLLHDGGVYVVAAVSAAARLDLHKLRELLGATRDLRLASEQEIGRDFAVPPFGPSVPAAEVIETARWSHTSGSCAQQGITTIRS
jgi:prolyl-tRNA editing enzyme YbaK/EbsC (Cys-tRNA(Pro) deacylase)